MDADCRLGLSKGEFVSLVSSHIQIKSKSRSPMGNHNHELDGDFYTHLISLRYFLVLPIYLLLKTALSYLSEENVFIYIKHKQYFYGTIYIYMHMNNTLDLLNDFLLESKGHLWLIACHVAILVFC